MKIKLKTTYLLILLLCVDHSIASTNLIAQTAKEPPQTQPSQLIGRWSPNCERFGGIKIHHKKKIIIEVNANQIYILSHGNTQNNTLDIFLDHPEDLGRGGMILQWNLFSKRIPIAKLTLNSAESAAVEWLGFYNETSRSREWINEPDFVGPDNLIFSKCNE